MKFKKIFLMFFCILFLNKLISSEYISNSQSLSILSWNIKMFSAPYGWFQNNIERSDNIIEFLKNYETYDIILFQEAFSISVRKKIFNALKNKYPNQIDIIDNVNFSKINSGLWAISSVPITHIDNINFTDLKNYDWFSSKGAHLYSINKSNQIFYIINTHLQADYKIKYNNIRVKQYTQIKEELIVPFVHFKNPLFLCGDLNISEELILIEMLNKLDLVNGPLTGKIQHSFFDKNYFLLDYILMNQTKFKFHSIERRILDILINKMEFSDHYPIEAKLKW